MFARVLALLPFMLLASASHLDARGQCNSGNVKCCNMQSYNDAAKDADVLKALVALAANVDAPVGTNCSPISVVGLGGNSCTQQTVCCSGNDFNGVVALGCVPININA